MAKFNWFSRTFNSGAQQEKPAETEDTSAASQTNEQSSTVASPPETAPTSSPEDYLAWAKAAYQNIQQQSPAPGQSAADDGPPVAVETTNQDAAAASEAPAPMDKPSTVSTDTNSAGGGTPPRVPATASAEAVADANPEPEPDSTAVEPSAASEVARPAWMQAATAERQARLERLQEEAIAEPDPDPQPEREDQEAEVTEPLLPDINFDEAFLWSAEVLAAQGRQASDVSVEEITWLKRLRQGLDKTRRGLINDLKAIVGQGPLNEDAVFEIEASLLQADVGVEATDAIIEALQKRLREETLPPEQAIAYLKKILRDMLDQPLGDSHNLTFVPDKAALNIWLLTGVNGAGKTTTIGKLAHIAQKSDYTCLIGAADTFRAAAVEQVKAWGVRSGVEVIANPGKNTDPAAVVFDAIAAAQSRNIDLLLVDTAGRLQNKKNLMDELAKIRRIIDKKAPDARVEALLVLDATLGQNGLRQAEIFSEAANLSGVVLTKLDGTAKGGVALAVVQQLGLPIRFIGAGEGIEDLRPFSSYEFVEALLSS